MNRFHKPVCRFAFAVALCSGLLIMALMSAAGHPAPGNGKAVEPSVSGLTIVQSPVAKLDTDSEIRLWSPDPLPASMESSFGGHSAPVASRRQFGFGFLFPANLTLVALHIRLQP
jgi:hypothetical protein